MEQECVFDLFIHAFVKSSTLRVNGQPMSTLMGQSPSGRWSPRSGSGRSSRGAGAGQHSGSTTSSPTPSASSWRSRGAARAPTSTSPATWRRCTSAAGAAHRRGAAVLRGPVRRPAAAQQLLADLAGWGRSRTDATGPPSHESSLVESVGQDEWEGGPCPATSAGGPCAGGVRHVLPPARRASSPASPVTRSRRRTRSWRRSPGPSTPARSFLAADNPEAWLRTVAVNVTRTRWRRGRFFRDVSHRARRRGVVRRPAGRPPRPAGGAAAAARRPARGHRTPPPGRPPGARGGRGRRRARRDGQGPAGPRPCGPRPSCSPTLSPTRRPPPSGPPDEPAHRPRPRDRRPGAEPPGFEVVLDRAGAAAAGAVVRRSPSGLAAACVVAGDGVVVGGPADPDDRRPSPHHRRSSTTWDGHLRGRRRLPGRASGPSSTTSGSTCGPSRLSGGHRGRCGAGCDVEPCHVRRRHPRRRQTSRVHRSERACPRISRRSPAGWLYEDARGLQPPESRRRRRPVRDRHRLRASPT